MCGLAFAYSNDIFARYQRCLKHGFFFNEIMQLPRVIVANCQAHNAINVSGN